MIVLAAPIIDGLDDLFRDAVDAHGNDRRERLAIVIDTLGGSIDVVERIADTARCEYNHIDFFVLDRAMSAGTVLVMAGDEIYMDNYARLGPIDPQVQTGNGKLLPALGYLEQYKKLLERSEAGNLTTAEMALLIEKFDLAELYRFEQAVELSYTLLEGWLANYKFKDWIFTETRKEPVTPDMKSERAKEIARKLSDTRLWHSHSRRISKEHARKVLNLRIRDLEETKLYPYMRTYIRILKDYMARRDQIGIVHYKDNYVSLLER